MIKASLFLALAACGASSAVPPPECAAGDVARPYPLTARFDGARGLELFAARVAVGSRVTGSLQNELGNDPLNRAQIRAFVNACDGRVLGAVTAIDFAATEPPATFTAVLDLSLFPDAATLDLFVTPLYARGQHLVDVSNLQIAGAP